MLGSLDRAPGSPLRGSFSRRSWQYRFSGTFHSAAPQCAIHPLLKLWDADIPGNPLRGSGHLRHLIGAAAEFTASLQSRDGSFAEWYPGQPSYCATAHLLAHLSEAAIAAAPEWPALAGQLLPSVERAAGWLARRDGTQNGNQAAAALLGLVNGAALLGSRWGVAARRLRDRLLSHASPDGWIPEQGGPDPGYLSVSLDFLSRAHDRGEGGLEQPIAAGFRLLDRVLMPDGSLPAALSWRGTNFLLPYAAERWSREDPHAAGVARRLREAVRRGLLPTPATVDDHYCGLLFLPSYADAYLAVASGGPAEEAGAGEVAAETPSPEYVIRRCGDILTMILARRGTFAAFSRERGRILLEDRGYCIESPAGLFLAGTSDPIAGMAGTDYRWESSFRRVGGTDPWSRRVGKVLPCIFSLHPMLPSPVRNGIEARLREGAFGPGKRIPVSIGREIAFGKNGIRIRDRIDRTGAGAFRIRSLRSTIPSNNPCSGFFAGHELDGIVPQDGPLEMELSRALEGNDRVEIDRILDPEKEPPLECSVNGRRIPPG